MTTGDNPGVELDWTLWCSRHLEPLRAGWPSGAMLAMMGLFTAAVRDERIIEAAGGDANNITGVLQIVKPVCCYIADGLAEEIVILAQLGTVWGHE